MEDYRDTTIRILAEKIRSLETSLKFSEESNAILRAELNKLDTEIEPITDVITEEYHETALEKKTPIERAIERRLRKLTAFGNS